MTNFNLSRPFSLLCGLFFASFTLFSQEKEVISEDDKKAIALERQIDSALNSGFDVKAAKLIREYLKIEPTNLEKTFQLADVYLSINKPENSLPLLNLLIKTNQSPWKERAENLYGIAKNQVSINSQINLTDGKIHFSEGNLDDARRSLRKVWYSDPKNGEALFYLTKVYVRQNKPMQAQIFASQLMKCRDFERESILEDNDFIRLICYPKYRQLIADTFGKEALQKLYCHRLKYGELTFSFVPPQPKHRGSEKLKMEYGFWISQKEITNAQYQTILKIPETKENSLYAPISQEDLAGMDIENFSMNSNDFAKLPVVNITWFEAIKFSKAFKKQTGIESRLPNEYEWEIACLNGKNSDYSWGNRISEENANYSHRSYGKTNPELKKPGQFEPNSLGLFDMHGNVAEWTLDDFPNAGPGFYRPIHKNEDKRVKGGSWNHDKEILTAISRLKVNPYDKYNWLGFRIIFQ